MNILITGVSSGIGKSLAEHMIAKGHTVCGVARSEDELKALHARLGDRFSYFSADITRIDDVRTLCLKIKQEKGIPDAIVLNAGIYPHDSDNAFQFDIAEQVLATNVNGALIFVDQFLPEFLQRGSGQFLAVSSVLALRPDPLGASYAASKAAITMAFRSLKLRYGSSGILFQTILLGPIATENYKSNDHKKAVTERHIPNASKAAEAIEQALHKKKSLTYYPWMIGIILRTTAWLPDTVFQALTKPFRR
jgi:short-subunit dehydrogenase